MTSLVLKSVQCVGLCASLTLLATAATAQQQSTNRVAAKTNWSVFVEDNPTECWSVSAPEETVNTKDGRVVAVNRDDILLLVSNRPGSNVSHEISFTGGYTFQSGSTVNVNIGGSEFELFTDGSWAWPASPSDDAKIVTSMQRGANAILTARSSRGTVTKDTFSLLGFTAALEEADKRCSR